MAYHLGIDLGTTYTAAAVARDGRVEPVPLGQGTTVASVVFLADDGGLVIGTAAQLRAATEPSRVVREFKRRVGDPVPILLGGHPVAAELLMARVLDWVVAEVAAAEGEQPAAVVVTHPANWGTYKLDLLRQAIRDVGLRVDGLVPEPVAAATFYASQRDLPEGTVVAVYDLGGGTFDAALVRAGRHGFEIVGQPDGVERLGGIDFDHAVLRHVARAAGVDLDALGLDVHPAVALAITRLRQECVAAKEALSVDTDVAVPVTLPDRYTEVRLTRAGFEDMIRPALDETIVALRRAIASARLTAADSTAVLLAGGSSRIPLVARLVTAELGRPVAADARPKDATSLGAALVAERHAPMAPSSVVAHPSEGPASQPLPPPPAAPAPTVGRHARRRRSPGRLLAPVTAALVGVVAIAGTLLLRTDTGGEPARADEAAGAQGPDSTSTTENAPADVPEEATGTADEPVVQASAGLDHGCAVGIGESGTATGTVTCWGNDEDGQASPPSEPFDVIDAGVGVTCGIRVDDSVADLYAAPAGPITCWGNSNQGRTSPPASDRFSSVSVGGGHSCALEAPDEDIDPDNISVASRPSCWGRDDQGQSTVPGFGNGLALDLSAGGEHTCVLKFDWGGAGGDALCWGRDDHGQSTPPYVEGLSPPRYSSISAGFAHTCAIQMEDKLIACWGDNGAGQASPPPEQFLAVSAGSGHTCGIRTDNTVTCWGDGVEGLVPPGEFASIDAGESATCGVRTDDTVVCWGSGPVTTGPALLHASSHVVRPATREPVEPRRPR
jgi:actin-like ATPase involved in cell morphogenesis